MHIYLSIFVLLSYVIVSLLITVFWFFGCILAFLLFLSNYRLSR